MRSADEPRFSLYDTVDWQHINGFTERRSVLANWCRAVELAYIVGSYTAMIYAGFQRLTYLTPILHRYKKMSRTASAIWVLGQPGDRDLQTDGLNVLRLQEDDPLCGEWFLIVNHPAYGRALVARELTQPGLPHADRRFHGMITRDPTLIAQFAALLKEHVEKLQTA